MKKFETIRQEIKKLSDEQSYYKPLRKPKNAYAPTKTAGVTPFGATSNVQRNKYELRHLFEAYAILKGTTRPEIKRPSNYNGQVLDKSKVEALVEKYKPEVVE